MNKREYAEVRERIRFLKESNDFHESDADFTDREVLPGELNRVREGMAVAEEIRDEGDSLRSEVEALWAEIIKVDETVEISDDGYPYGAYSRYGRREFVNRNQGVSDLRWKVLESLIKECRELRDKRDALRDQLVGARVVALRNAKRRSDNKLLELERDRVESENRALRREYERTRKVLIAAGTMPLAHEAFPVDPDMVDIRSLRSEKPES